MLSSMNNSSLQEERKWTNSKTVSLKEADERRQQIWSREVRLPRYGNQCSAISRVHGVGVGTARCWKANFVIFSFLASRRVRCKSSALRKRITQGVLRGSDERRKKIIEEVKMCSKNQCTEGRRLLSLFERSDIERFHLVKFNLMVSRRVRCTTEGFEKNNINHNKDSDVERKWWTSVAKLEE